MMWHNQCPSCGSPDIKKSLECTDWLVSKEKFQVFSCSQCEFYFTQSAPDEKDAGKYYESEDYISHTDSSRNLFEKLYKIAREVMLSRKRHLVSKSSGLKTGKLLDVGSGTGHFLASARQAGWECEGIEISEKARGYAIYNLGLVVNHPSHLSDYKDSSFDVITLWHVLEHFHDPSAYIEEIKRILRDNGKLLIALPNRASFDCKHYKESWAAWDTPRHLWHFSPASFTKYAEDRGFKIQKVHYLPFDVFYISILSERLAGKRFPLIIGVAKGSWFSFRSLFNRKGGSSLAYVLVKSDQYLSSQR